MTIFMKNFKNLSIKKTPKSINMFKFVTLLDFTITKSIHLTNEPLGST